MTVPINARQAFNILLREDFKVFLEMVFQTLNPNEPFLDNWHVDAICYRLEQMHRGTVNNFLLTIPPRHLKSIACSVAFPAFVIGHDPSQKFMVASYGGDLSTKLARDFRTVMNAGWYQSMFPDLGPPKRDVEADYETRLGGGRKAVSVGGASTGFGAHWLIVDDLMKADAATRTGDRDAALNFFKDTLLSRLQGENGKTLVIAQRIHEDDVPGHCISSGLFAHLNLPAIAEERQAVKTGPSSVHMREVGDLLFPQWQSQSYLDDRRRLMGAAAFSTQYQQNPIPLGGNLVKWDTIHRYKDAPERNQMESVVQSWDTGFTADPKSDYSVCTTWGRHRGRWLLLDVFRRQLEFNELATAARQLIRTWRPEFVLVERIGSGIPLHQELLRDTLNGRNGRGTGPYTMVACHPKVAKVIRFESQTLKFEEGFCALPEEADWLATLKHEMLGFPNARHDDQVDSLSQFLNWAGSGRSREFFLERERPGRRPR